MEGAVKQVLYPMIGGKCLFEPFISIQADSIISKGGPAWNKQTWLVTEFVKFVTFKDCSLRNLAIIQDFNYYRKKLAKIHLLLFETIEKTLRQMENSSL